MHKLQVLSSKVIGKQLNMFSVQVTIFREKSVCETDIGNLADSPEILLKS